MILTLTELKNSFLPYEDFWQLWKRYAFNDLKPVEIEIIEVYRQGHFSIPPNHADIGYNTVEVTNYLMKPLVKKLKNGYTAYKEWVVLKFLCYIVSQANEYGIDSFYGTDIDQLPIDLITKFNFKKFGFPNIGDMLACFGEIDLMQEDRFNIVLCFQSEIKKHVEKRQCNE